jgi:hypothetical protein
VADPGQLDEGATIAKILLQDAAIAHRRGVVRRGPSKTGEEH